MKTIIINIPEDCDEEDMQVNCNIPGGCQTLKLNGIEVFEITKTAKDKLFLMPGEKAYITKQPGWIKK